MTAHFMDRGYPMKLLEEALQLAKSKDRDMLLEQEKSKGEDDETPLFLITTYNPNFMHLRSIVYDNWEMLGKSPTTQYIHDKKLMCGFRRPKNLRDILVRANIPFKEGDENVRTEFSNEMPNAQSEQRETKEPVAGTSKETAPTKIKKQSTILDFMFPKVNTNINPKPLGGATSLVTDTKMTSCIERDTPSKIRNLTPQKDIGFNFCNTKNCRYCPKLNKSGQIKSKVTGKVFQSMKNISCRSSNLIYCIKCKRCDMQYVGQTRLRLKNRFVHHLYTVDKADKSKPVGKHFSASDHQGIDDIEIYVLEFISKPPRSLAAESIRDRVEKRWIHLLKKPAPGGVKFGRLANLTKATS
jgi:hypothetical protein